MTSDLLDHVLPAHDVRDAHSVRIAAPRDRVDAALRAVTAREVPILTALTAIRALPSLLTGRRRRIGSRERPLFEVFQEGGFALLADEPARELVVGVIGQFWRLRGGGAQPIRDIADFREFAVPGYAKAAINFRMRPSGRGTLLSTETRVRATDAAARRAFRRYWRVIYPGSALIRWAWLRAIRRRAERGAGHQASISTRPVSTS